MELLILLFILGLVIATYFQWIIIVIVTLIAMSGGGFFAGLGAGLFTYFLLKASRLVAFIYLGGKAIKQVHNNEPKENHAQR